MTQAERDKVTQAIARAEEGTGTRVAVRIIPDQHVDAMERAKAEFLHAGLHEHEEHNAALILVAPKARQFAVLGDRALHERVGEGFWSEVVDGMRVEFARGAIADAIIHGLDRLGDALRTHFGGSR